jgi:hypothetical protein
MMSSSSISLENITISSKYGIAYFHISDLSILFMVLWKVADALNSQNSM